MSFDSYLAIIGGLFLISVIGSFWLDERPKPIAALMNISVDGLIRFIGIVGLAALILGGFGVGSWLFGVLYWEVIVRIAGLLGLH